MFALPGTLFLILTIYAKPQAFEPSLEDVPLLHVFLAITILGVLADVATGTTRLVSTPQLPYMTAFYVWAALTIAIRKPGELGKSVVVISISWLLYLIIAHGIQTFGGFVRLTQAIVALGLFVAFVGVHQGFSPFGCVVHHPTARDVPPVPDGRPCMTIEAQLHSDGVAECVEGGQPGLVYGCERVGLLDTVSVGGGRVRYVGQLADPNDLALATSMALPFAFAFFEQKKSALRLALLLFALCAIGLEIVLTQSRGGQITFAAVLAVYFMKKYGWKRGLVVGGLFAVPAVLFGGRSGESADESSLERLGCAAEGIKMMMWHPITGIGFGQFVEHHSLTAHNAYLLAAGELGFIGVVLFVTLVYVSIKVPLAVLRTELDEGPETAGIQSMATAMLAAFVGAAIGIFFLSWTYHYVLWINFGLSGSLYAIVRARQPRFSVRVRAKEIAWIAAGVLAFIVVYAFYIRLKGAWG